MKTKLIRNYPLHYACTKWRQELQLSLLQWEIRPLPNEYDDGWAMEKALHEIVEVTVRKIKPELHIQ